MVAPRRARQAVFPKLPTYKGDDPEIKELYRFLSTLLETLKLQEGKRTLAAGSFTVSNLTEDSTYDADSTTVAELADVLGTLILYLKQRGIVA